MRRTGRSCWRGLGARSPYRTIRDWFDWFYTPQERVRKVQWVGLAEAYISLSNCRLICRIAFTDVYERQSRVGKYHTRNQVRPGIKLLTPLGIGAKLFEENLVFAKL